MPTTLSRLESHLWEAAKPISILKRNAWAVYDNSGAKPRLIESES